MKRRFGGAQKGRQRAAILRPGYLAALAGVLVLGLATFAYYEIRQSRRMVLESMQRGAVSLVEAVARGGENALRSDAEIEALLAERLLDNARLIGNLDSRVGLSDTMLVRIAGENALFRINVFDVSGRRVATNATGEHGRGHGMHAARGELGSILSGEVDERIIGFRKARYESGNRFAAAVRRRGGGAIVVNIDATRMLAFRRAAGVGRLIQEIGENPGVVYVVLQDREGILLASRSVTQMPRIDGDAFLKGVLTASEARSRETAFEGQAVFETAMPFAVDEKTDGVLRIGLSADALQAEETRVTWRLGMLAGLLVILGVTGVGLVAVRQNYVLLDEAYDRIQTYSSRILGQMADAVVATDPEGRIEVFNTSAEQLFGVSSAEALGRDFRDVLGDGAPILGRTLEAGDEVQGETCQFRTPQDRERMLSVSTSFIRDATNGVETVVAVIQDLTEKAALEADLKRQDRLAAMGELASGVAHEVRNPLNAIGMIVQRLEKEFEPVTDGKGYRRLTTTVRGEVQRVNRIVHQFLTFARPPKLAPREVALTTLLEETVRVIEARARARGLRVVRSLVDVGQVRVDPGQMVQAVLNLLENAVDATPSGEIRISSRIVDEQWVEIGVKDTGKGITQEHLERIFDLYFTTKPEGTGLGLSMVHRIVSEHGGRIEVESQQGKGTLFRVLLPRRG